MYRTNEYGIRIHKAEYSTLQAAEEMTQAKSKDKSVGVQQKLLMLILGIVFVLADISHLSTWHLKHWNQCSPTP